VRRLDSVRGVLELKVRWYTVVYILDVNIRANPRVSWGIKSSTSTVLQHLCIRTLSNVAA
jgi:hypothetical protein